MHTSDLAIPTLPSRSLPATVTFYERLGFTGRLLGVGDSYAVLTRGSIELHFFTHPALRPAESIAGCYIRVADADALFAAFRTAALPATGIPRLDAIGDKPWGMREFAVVDEDGNLLRIGQVL
ncbi:MAG: VOC family protein [Planctomycetes bacterium]|nr:VOC family protein [Planctomycetota bacterium]